MPDIWMDVDVNVVVPVNILPLLDDTDFKSIEISVVYNSPGMALQWNFVPCAGPATCTAVTPTTGGDYDWAEPLADVGMYTIEIPAVGGATINNNTEGVGWFTGSATGVLPWRGPTIGFRAAGLNNLLIESASSATRGLAGTALPDAVAGAANGLTILGANATGASFAGQVKITANVAAEGALDIVNANATGIGTRNSAQAIGQYNLGTGAGSAGQTNDGVAQGQHNDGATGQQNDGGAVGQYNFGTTYGAQNTGASGSVNVGTAGDGIYASGTDYGIQAAGVTGDIDPDFSGLLTGVNVTSIANNAITAASINTGAIDADALATDAADEIADHVWDEALAGHLGVGSTGAALNAVGGGATVFPTGAINFTYTVTDVSTGLPLEGVEVWISTDNPAVNIVWKGDTDAFGVARDVLGNLPALDVGVYFFWRQLAGYTFSDPDTETVS
jgi:hypothetical protein